MHGFRICGFSDLKLSGTPPEGGTLGLTTPRGMLSPRVPPGWVRGKQGGGPGACGCSARSRRLPVGRSVGRLVGWSVGRLAR